MGNCFSSPESQQKISGLEAQAKQKGEQFLQSKEQNLQGAGAMGNATAPGAGAGAGGAGGNAAGAGQAGGAGGGFEGKLENMAKGEAPQLEQMAQKEFTGAGGAGMGAGTSAAATPAAT